MRDLSQAAEPWAHTSKTPAVLALTWASQLLLGAAAAPSPGSSPRHSVTVISRSQPAPAAGSLPVLLPCHRQWVKASQRVPCPAGPVPASLAQAQRGEQQQLLGARQLFCKLFSMAAAAASGGSTGRSGRMAPQQHGEGLNNGCLTYRSCPMHHPGCRTHETTRKIGGSLPAVAGGQQGNTPRGVPSHAPPSPGLFS